MSDTAPVHALTVAPYPGMGIILSQVADTMPGISLDVREGDLEEAIHLVNLLDQEQYDVIISRGGTAKMLQDYTSLPVVEVKISVYDMLRKGCEKARAVAAATLDDVRRAMKINYFDDAELIAEQSKRFAAK